MRLREVHFVYVHKLERRVLCNGAKRVASRLVFYVIQLFRLRPRTNVDLVASRSFLSDVHDVLFLKKTTTNQQANTVTEVKLALPSHQ